MTAQISNNPTCLNSMQARSVLNPQRNHTHHTQYLVYCIHTMATNKRRVLSTAYGVSAACALSPADPEDVFPCPKVSKLVRQVAHSKNVPACFPIGNLMAFLSFCAGSGTGVRAERSQEKWCNLTIWEATIAKPGGGGCYPKAASTCLDSEKNADGSDVS